MTVYSGVSTFFDNFDRGGALSATPGHNGWVITDTSSSGAPTYTCTTEDGGSMKLTLASTSEVENICMSHGDVLAFDVRNIQQYWCIAKVAAVGSNSVVTFGLGSARADDEDTVATKCWFKMEGATSTTAVVIETDDAVTDDPDNATGETLAAVYKKFEIDFSYGIADIRFNIDGARVASGTTFSMSGLTAGLNVQPMFQVSKASSADVAALQIAQVGITYKWSYGA